jgi:hypothetical protein
VARGDKILEIVEFSNDIASKFRRREYIAISPDANGLLPHTLSRYNFSLSSRRILHHLPEVWRPFVEVIPSVE